ncbi:MAG: polysaccharide deacetylase family protein [Candidatus Omnitrophica bacterium]|nr:polysaccharide deacetylase family protein [Candidatus Omnitrophota bacterium]
MKIPVLLYHDVREDSFDTGRVAAKLRPYIIRESVFARQMEWLYDEGYKVVGAARLRDQAAGAAYKLAGGRIRTARNPYRLIGLVFDDGWKSNRTKVLPLLKKFGFTATFFVTLEYLGRTGMMDWADLSYLNLQGMEIGSHGMRHVSPRGCSDEELKSELIESRHALEARTGQRIESYSSPTGYSDERLAPLAREAGYRTVCVSRPALNDFARKEKFSVLQKTGIKRSMSFPTFSGIVRGDAGVYRKLRFTRACRSAVKTIIRPAGYEWVQARVMRSGR